jgi:hypothetical protein
MASELVVGYTSDMSEHVNMDSDVSSYCSVVVGGFEPPLPPCPKARALLMSQ